MKEIDVSSWKRKTPYECFSKYSNPVFSMTVRVDVTELVQFSKRTNTSFFANFLFVVSKCLNSLEDFRLRIHEGKVVLYDQITPSYIVMNDNGVIITSQTEFSNDYKVFYERVSSDIENAKHFVGQEKFNKDGQTDVFYTSCVRWVDFVSVNNPYNIPDASQTSIPRITWGKYVEENGRLKMSLDIAAHHALMDGYEMSQGFVSIQNALSNIEDFLK